MDTTVLNDDVIITTILLNTNVDDLHNVRFDDKLCNSAHYWKLRFEQDNLLLPALMCDTLSEWIECYHYTKKMMRYFDFIINAISKYDSGIYFVVHGISILNGFFDSILMK